MRTPLLLLAAALGLPGCRARRDFLTGTYPEDQARIRQVLDDIRAGFRSKDAARVEALHLYGPKFTRFDEGPPGDRPEAGGSREAERRALTGPASVDLDFRDPRIDVFGDVALPVRPDSPGAASGPNR